jgi:hypothetical protein
VNSTMAIDVLDTGHDYFGDHAYGLEPLFLPFCSLADSQAPARSALEPADLPSRCRSLIRAPSPTPPLPDISQHVDELYWFRWITGHQVTFTLWQLLERTLADASATACLTDRKVKLRHAALLVRGYSAMLLYCGSCTREVYHRLIRPSMARHHPRFSGAWARDYWGVRYVLRSGAPAHLRTGSEELTRTCLLNNSIHESIAQKLVPDAPSLLQGTIGQGRLLKRENLFNLYDTFFLTLRAPLSAGVVLHQLLRRIQAVTLDLDTNLLYPPFISNGDRWPDASSSNEIKEIAETMTDLLEAIARETVELMFDDSPDTRSARPAPS